jgi:hypothetical protein
VDEQKVTETLTDFAGNDTPAGTDVIAVDLERLLNLLAHGEVELQGLLPRSSNYTFLVTIRDRELQCLAVYKPRRGERPLWDFPQGTLCLREYAAYLVSEALAWSIIPPTVLRQGPYGFGSVQLYIDAAPSVNYFSLRDDHPLEFKRMALFDYLVNNADRKGGHCLKGIDGHIWGIDNALTFHAAPKLRTVIWDFAGEAIPTGLLEDLRSFRAHLSPVSPVFDVLSKLLEEGEVRAFKKRLGHLLKTMSFPEPEHWPDVPWPPV